MTNFLAVCEELVAALDPKVVLTDGYGPVTSLVLRIRAIHTNSNKSMTEKLPKYGTVAYCASKFVDYPPMTNQFPDATKMVLSPAAQAVFWAFNSKFSWIEDGVPGPQFKAIAAALRAAADQVISPVSPPCEDFNEYDQGFLAAHIKYRAELLAIADELDGLS